MDEARKSVLVFLFIILVFYIAAAALMELNHGFKMEELKVVHSCETVEGK
jgi:Na+(H+)/acetate symporter ActP